MPPLPSILLVFLAQSIALLLATLLEPIMPSLSAAQLILQGSFAAMAGRLLGLPYWWVPVNLLIPLLIATLLSATAAP